MYYESQQLHEVIDVGFVWRPSHQKGSSFAVTNRPPTRMHWWWAHGLPVIVRAERFETQPSDLKGPPSGWVPAQLELRSELYRQEFEPSVRGGSLAPQHHLV